MFVVVGWLDVVAAKIFGMEPGAVSVGKGTFGAREFAAQ
jgi:hypothetical protein